MTGEKLPMFVNWKSQKHRCFKEIKSTPCCYRGQEKSWMDSELSEEWVTELDDKLEKEGRKIALIIDNWKFKIGRPLLLPTNTTISFTTNEPRVVWSLKS